MPAAANSATLLTAKRISRMVIVALALSMALTACSLEALLPSTATFTPTITPIPPTATASATTTPSPMPTATFTATETPTLTATATDTPMPTATPTVYAVVRSQRRVNIRSGPGTRFAASGSLAPDSGVQVIGQSEDGDWYQVRLESGAEGWVSASLLLIEDAPPSFAADSAEGEAQRLSQETRIVVEIGGDVEDADSTDDILVINVPIADVDSMNMTATVLVGAGLTATADAATPAPDEGASLSTAEAPVATLSRATPQFDVKVFAFCNDPSFGIAAPSDLSTGSTVKIFWAWFASTDGYLRQHTSNATHELRVNGDAVRNVNQYRLNPSRSGNQHAVYWYVPYGPLDAGDYLITYRVTWRSPISDGFQPFGPGTATEFEEESCNFTVR